jgi:NADH-quinone oxidoreductase subunit C
MTEETKLPAPQPSGDDKPSAADQPAASGSPAATPPPSAAQPAAAEKPASAAPPKPAAPAAEKPAASAGEKPAASAPAAHKPAAPAKPSGPTPQPWNSPLVGKLKRQYGSGVQAWTYLGQNYLEVDPSLVPTVLQLLRDEEEFDYCVDITAVHYPQRERQFDLVWILYSFPRNERMRIKAQFADGEHVPSAVSIWPTANWLERETFDMFGIQFDGHPDLKRILLPDGWKGYPLRKDYGIIQQDNEWVQINLGIESGQ